MLLEVCIVNLPNRYIFFWLQKLIATVKCFVAQRGMAVAQCGTDIAQCETAISHRATELFLRDIDFFEQDYYFISTLASNAFL